MPGISLFVYPVEDLDRATSIYRIVLGIEPYVAAPYYVGFRVGDQEIGLDPHGRSQGMTGPVGYWEVDDIATSLRLLLDAGGTTRQEVRDVGGGKLTAWVDDGSGNAIGLVQSP
jgi:predicted enzyme related to lactoylglutathione lyase